VNHPTGDQKLPVAAALFCWFIFGASLALAITSFLLPEIIFDEAGHTRPIAAYGVGFYVWLTAVGLTLLTSVGLFLTAGKVTCRHSRTQV
jgi:hypothetical protein